MWATTYWVKTGSYSIEIYDLYVNNNVCDKFTVGRLLYKFLVTIWPNWLAAEWSNYTWTAIDDIEEAVNISN